MVYASSTRALAALEYLVHLDVEDVPGDLLALAVEVPERAGAEDVDPATLPRGWNARDEHPACLAAGAAWLQRGRALLLRERNVLLDPRHPDMALVRVASSREFAYDPRLLAG